jgi:F420-dependent oxidoreductase-like protein
MKFGIHNASWVYGADPAAAFEGAKQTAQWAETHGFTWFSVMDHLIQVPFVGAPDEPFMEGWTVLAALAAVTSRIRLGVLASSVAYRNPAHLAKIAAGVDLISRGRLTFGIGAGWYEAEYRQYGWEFPERPAVRIQQMEEAVRLIRAMWTEPRTSFQGRYFQVHDAILEPKPLQKPHPPILIAGGGEQLTLRAVARLGNACNVSGSPDEVRQKLAILRGHCEAAGRSYEAIEKTAGIYLLLARDQAALTAKLAGRVIPESYRVFVGTVPEVSETFGRYRDAGVQLMITRAHGNDRETYELLASDVMPALAQRTSAQSGFLE